jgi:uncharacterized protein YcbK (DUF882 family)
MHAILVSVVLLSTVHAPARLPRPTFPAVALYGPNLNESLRFRPYDDRGRPRKAALGELSHFLRCRHTGKQRRVDPRLMRALYTVGRHFAGHRLEVYSGYRPRAFCTRAHSRHLTASAVDFHVDGVDNEALVRWLRATFHPSGVGYYPNGVHVHLDLDRAHDTYWVDAGDDTREPADADADSDAVVALPSAPEPVPATITPPLDDPAFD